MRSSLVVYLKGFLMGTADAVPGVSGGTIALIAGIYERLVDAIAGLTEVGPAVLADLLRPHDPTARARFRESVVEMDLAFLAVLAAGVVSGAVSLANVVDYALVAFRGPTFAFFFGLIAASPIVLRSEISLDDTGPAVAGLLGFAFAFVLSGLADARLPDGPVVLFLVGAVAICAMVLPGISGSLLLLLFGKYHVMTGAVSDLTGALGGAANGRPLDAAVAPATTLVVFVAGATVGILLFARVVSWALDTYRTATMTFLVGLLVGALRRPVVEILDATAAWTPATAAVLLVAALLGAAAVLLLDSVTGGIEH